MLAYLVTDEVEKGEDKKINKRIIQLFKCRMMSKRAKELIETTKN